MPRGASHRIAFADALRTIAIVSVVICHMVAVLPHASDSFAAQLEDIGGWGVGTFFVLTGFLLARPYLEALLNPAAASFPSARLFFKRRFYRIFPLYAVAIIITAIGTVLHGHYGVRLENVVVHLTFLQGFFPADEGAPFGPLWTMAVDAQFYCLLPLIALAMFALLAGRSRVVRLRAIVLSIAGTIALSLAWRTVVSIHAPIVLLDFNTSLVYVRNVLGMGSSFALGIGLALLEVLQFKPSSRTCAAAVAAALFLIGAFFFVSVRGDRLLAMIIGDFLAGLSAVLLLGGLIEGRFTTLARIARSPETKRLAALSYAIYLFHKPVIFSVHDFLAAHGHADSPTDVAILVLASIVILGVVSAAAHHWIEKPFLNLRNKSREQPLESARTSDVDAGTEIERPATLVR